MKNAKLGLFISALTLALAIPTGVYAHGNNNQGNYIKSNSTSQKIEYKNVKSQSSTEKFKQYNEYKTDKINNKDLKKDEIKKNLSKKECIKKCIDKKIVLSAENKAALKVKIDAIKKVKTDNKAIKDTIKTNKEAVKVELARIEKLNNLTAEQKAKVAEALLAIKDTKADAPKTDAQEIKYMSSCTAKEAIAVAPEKTDAQKLEVKPVCTVVDPAVAVKPVVATTTEVKPIIDPTVEANPVVAPTVEVKPISTVVVPAKPVEQTDAQKLAAEETYVKKINSILDKVLEHSTSKNTELTNFSQKIIDLLTALKLIV